MHGWPVQGCPVEGCPVEGCPVHGWPVDGGWREHTRPPDKIEAARFGGGTQLHQTWRGRVRPPEGVLAARFGGGTCSWAALLRRLPSCGPEAPDLEGACAPSGQLMAARFGGDRQVPRARLARAGMPCGGMPRGGMPRARLARAGMPCGRMPCGGMPRARLARAGMPRRGMPRGGMPRGGTMVVNHDRLPTGGSRTITVLGSLLRLRPAHSVGLVAYAVGVGVPSRASGSISSLALRLTTTPSLPPAWVSDAWTTHNPSCQGLPCIGRQAGRSLCVHLRALPLTCHPLSSGDGTHRSRHRVTKPTCDKT